MKHPSTTPVELHPYPFPEGMAIPRLMPFQEYPWNGDHFIAEEVLRLKAAHGLTNALETGTCLGSTTCWLVENFPFHIRSYETNTQFHAIAMERVPRSRIRDHSNPMVDLVLGNSATELEMVDVDGMADRTFVFLDAHPMSGRGEDGYATVLKELVRIADTGAKPCLLLHDFQVPGLPEAGWDAWNGQPFTLEWVKVYLDKIYGEGGWKHNYPKEVAGARRGWISIEPVK